ncbi:MAG: hypothetical protein Q8P76_04405 [bacterium]|nr:hypothetical protein [bacterium]
MEQFPQAPSPENLESEIEKLLEQMETFADLYTELSPEDQDAWYDAEMEAKVGKDRAAAKEHLQKFLDYLKKQKKS